MPYSVRGQPPPPSRYVSSIIGLVYYYLTLYSTNRSISMFTFTRLARAPSTTQCTPKSCQSVEVLGLTPTAPLVIPGWSHYLGTDISSLLSMSPASSLSSKVGNTTTWSSARIISTYLSTPLFKTDGVVISWSCVWLRIQTSGLSMLAERTLLWLMRW